MTIIWKFDITKVVSLCLQGDFRVKVEEKLKVCRNVLRDLGEDPVEGLNMIDAIQRLGIDYYFQEEIGVILHRQYVESSAHGDFGQDLHEVALSFRLLRQQGYFVPAGGYYFLFW